MPPLAKLIRLACRRLLLWTVCNAPVLAALVAGCGGATVEVLAPAYAPTALEWAASIGVTWAPPPDGDPVPQFEADCCAATASATATAPAPAQVLAWHLQAAAGPLEATPSR